MPRGKMLAALQFLQCRTKLVGRELDLLQNLGNQWAGQISSGVMRDCCRSAVVMAIEHMAALLTDGLES